MKTEESLAKNSGAQGCGFESRVDVAFSGFILALVSELFTYVCTFAYSELVASNNHCNSSILTCLVTMEFSIKI